MYTAEQPTLLKRFGSLCLGLFLLGWLCLVPLHVQHEAGFRAPDGTFVSATLAAQLDCLPFPLSPEDTSPPTECPVLQLWNAGHAPLSTSLPPTLPPELLQQPAALSLETQNALAAHPQHSPSLRAPPVI